MTKLFLKIDGKTELKCEIESHLQQMEYNKWNKAPILKIQIPGLGKIDFSTVEVYLQK